jgi:ribosomal protein S18 acetylase RimI-like enzyme
MAARSEPIARQPEIVDIRRLVGRELDPLLLEETVEWQTSIDWDFARSADLVRQYADMRALNGFALLDKGEVAGYGYSVVEESKGLIGDLYVRSAWRNSETEVRLFRAMLDALIATPNLQRIESQLMLIGKATAKALQGERFIRIHERLLMTLDGIPPLSRSAGAVGRRFRFEPFANQHHDLAAGVIALAYNRHIDSQINDQYRSLAGARRFIHNIVQFPGCGIFFKPGSVVAFDRETGWLAGLVLVSFVGDEVGHVTQLCVTPSVKGTGLGYELLCQAVAALRLNGAKRVSLTVTSANTEAIRLYQRCGFREMRRFFAYVWESY